MTASGFASRSFFFAPTRWRAMTVIVRSDATLNSESVIPDAQLRIGDDASAPDLNRAQILYNPLKCPVNR
jgi:hypothetical protein